MRAYEEDKLIRLIKPLTRVLIKDICMHVSKSIHKNHPMNTILNLFSEDF